MKTNDFTFVKKFFLALIAFFISLLNEYYLRVVANYYAANYYESLIPDIGFYSQSLYGRLYFNLANVPFSIFIFIQFVFFIIVFLILVKIIKQKGEIYQIFIASTILSIISYGTATPYYKINFFETLFFGFAPFFITYFVIVVHVLIIFFAFYFFMNKKNDK